MYTIEQNQNLAKIATNKSLLKEFKNLDNNRVVYLKDNQEFQIQIFNPYNYSICCSISINGIDQSNRLVVKPGQRIWLDRFFDSPQKFKFSTYEVENINQSKNAIKNNGEIKIKFFREETPYCNNYNITYTQYYNTPNYTHSITDDYCNNSITTNYCSNANITSSTNSIVTSASTYYNFNNSSIETGRVERGSQSNQEFSYTNDNFEYWTFRIETIKILPYSQKPITNNDMKKIYCTECGRKLNTKFKYCPYCGQKL